MAFNTPVLFLIYNRPDTTIQVFEQIRKIKPGHLYVVADGPRKDKLGEKEKTDEVRNIVLAGIDWQCEVKTLFRDENLGCGKSVSGAIDWFFENVEEGIILEDDTLPDLSFFNFCEIQLKRYASTKNIKIISGNNFQNNIIRGDGSYYFSKYVHIWGWATWKRTWQSYDFDLQEWMSCNIKKRRELFTIEKEYNYWNNIFDLAAKKEIDTWDYQLFYLSLITNGINVMPNKNLVVNIGFSQDSTHTKTPNHKLANLNMFAYDQDIIPSKMKADDEADSYTFYNVYSEPFLPVGKRKSIYLLFMRIIRKPYETLRNLIKNKGNE